MTRLFTLAAVSLVIVACDSGGPDPQEEASALSGSWITTESASFGQEPDLDLNLTFSSNGRVTGSGTLAQEPARIGDPITTYLDLRVEGTWTPDRISLELTRTVNSSFAATLSVDRAACLQTSYTVGTNCDASITGSQSNPDFAFFKTD
ncbi:hypothetical protein [Rubrivirga sp. IMCC43871]|uniref:hypothetical protein n=1 Tax=Rubrivirga sp. IMCC43871 TaxID=3391575 RepID=UPI0039900D85